MQVITFLFLLPLIYYVLLLEIRLSKFNFFCVDVLRWQPDHTCNNFVILHLIWSHVVVIVQPASLVFLCS